MLGVKNAQTIQKLVDMLELDTSEHVRILVSSDHTFGPVVRSGHRSVVFRLKLVKALYHLAPNNKLVNHAFGNLEKTSSIYQ